MALLVNFIVIKIWKIVIIGGNPGTCSQPWHLSWESLVYKKLDIQLEKQKMIFVKNVTLSKVVHMQWKP